MFARGYINNIIQISKGKHGQICIFNAWVVSLNSVALNPTSAILVAVSRAPAFNCSLALAIAYRQVIASPWRIEMVIVFTALTFCFAATQI
jgi:hypothetical protein